MSYLRSHEWELFLNAGLNTLGVDDQTAENVVHEDQEGVGAKVHFRNVDTTNGRVIKSTLHPLRGVGGDEVCVEVSKTADEKY